MQRFATFLKKKQGEKSSIILNYINMLYYIYEKIDAKHTQTIR